MNAERTDSPPDRPAVRVDRQDRIARVWLDRAPLNILDLEMTRGLEAALGQISADEGIDVVVLRGGGPKAFSAGVSIHDHTPDKVESMLRGFHGVVRRLHAMEAVTVAAVDGHCLGGGLELAAACDLVIASDRSRFAQPEIQLACFPPVAAALFPPLLGGPRANDLVLTGRTLSAAEAERWGLISRLAEADRFEAALDELCGTLTALSGAVLRLSKQALRAGRERGFVAALDEAERLYLEDLVRTEDMEEGIRAFLERRAPAWVHR